MVVSNWACIKCGVTNPKTAFKCQTCQQPKPIFWECTSCKVKNPTAALKCNGCKRKRPSIFGNTVNVKEMPKSTSTGEESSAPPASTEQSSSLPLPTSSTPTTTMSSIGGPVCSTISQATPNATMSTLSQSVSSYDVFVKLNKPNRTVKQFAYVDSEEKFKQAIENCAKTNGQYSDASFKPSLYSLYFDPKQKKQQENLPRVYWLRPKDMRPPEIADPKSPVLKLPWAVIRDPVSDDITQGVLGNCWLLSALAVLVEKPTLLDKVLATKEVTPQGIYRVRLYRDGKLISVNVDDQFPCNNKRLLVYSCAKRKQLFVPIIEKAMSKMYGCYEALVSGQTCEGLSALTGYPCRSIRTQVVPAAQPRAEEEAMLGPDFIWTLLLSFQSAGFLMGAGCGSSTDCTIDSEEYAQKGLVMQHAYTIIDVVNAGPETRLLQLRNPWGRQVWTGDWSDESTCWTPELREQLKPTRANEGVFWMAFSDFQRYFEKVDVCKIRTEWHELRYEGYFPSSSADLRYLSVFEVQVEEASTELEVTLHQESRRAVNLHKTPLLPICAAIFQLKDVQTKTCGDLVDFSGYKIREFLGCDVMLDKGVYLIATYAFNHWHAPSSATKTGATLRPRFVMSLHSSRPVTINCHCPVATIQGETLIELVTAKGRKKQHDDNVFSYYLTCTDNWSGMAMVIENRHNDSYLEVIFDAAESTNLHSTRGSLMTQDTIPPMSRQLVNVLSHLDPNTAYYLSYQTSYRVSSQAATNHNPDLGPLASLHSPRPFKPASKPDSE